MMISPGIDAAAFLGRVRTVVVDEVHAFAGDDRGWHLLALLERITRLLAACRSARASARPVQRLGRSATIGDRSCTSAGHLLRRPLT